MATKKKSNPIQSIGNFLGSIFNKPQMPQPKTAKELGLSPTTELRPTTRRKPPPGSGGQPSTLTPPTNLYNVPPAQAPLYQPPMDKQLYRPQPLYQPQPTSQPPSGQQINYGGQTPTGTTPISGEVTGKTEAELFIERGIKTVQDLISNANLDTSDPFALDELLSKNAAIRNISPYYASVWDRFINAVKRENQSSQLTEQRKLGELQQGGENYQTKLSRLLSLGQQQTGEQFAGQGLYESGGRLRGQGLQNVTASQDLSNFLQGQQRGQQSVRQEREDMLNRLLAKQQEEQANQYRAQSSDVEAAVAEAQRVASSRQGIAALEGQPLTNANLPEYFQKRGETLAKFLPSASYG